MDLTKIAEFANPLWSTLLGAPGMWAFVKAKTDRDTSKVKLLRAVAKNQLIEQGRVYLRRGYITMDEYEEYEAEYKLYTAIGGNGLARRIFEQVDDLPMTPNNIDGRNET